MPPNSNEGRTIVLLGRVQGVGFRPFVANLARTLNLCGWAQNRFSEFIVFVEGSVGTLEEFERRICEDAPPLARPSIKRVVSEPLQGLEAFTIRESSTENARPSSIEVPPDIATCEACLAELFDPTDRRHHYAFNNCTQCGPRYSLIEALPYDRERTAMADFELCEACRTEYDDPLDRRYHAEPIACSECGPRLSWQESGKPPTPITDDDVIERATAALGRGAIVAVKGIGGYHLMCNPWDPAAIQRLRQLKYRPSKPFALMASAPHADPLAFVQRIVEVDSISSEALLSPARPIVVLPKKPSDLAPGIAPNSDELGVMLAYSPLHHRLLASCEGTLVATSGNVGGEPMVRTPEAALERLGHIADAFVHHNRPIVRRVDDAVVRRVGSRTRPYRLGRGTAPLELELPYKLETPTLAFGSHMKNTVALAWGRRVVVSPHVGDLESVAATDALAEVVRGLVDLYGVEPAELLVDAHPGYASTNLGQRLAEEKSLKIRRIWHHPAHASALAGEFPSVRHWLTFTWDGVGLGWDQTLWGGELLVGRPGHWKRTGSIRPFDLLGAVHAGREPWRSAGALAWTAGFEFETEGGPLARDAWKNKLGVSSTSSVGRLFDAAACFVFNLTHATHEAEGPMALESAAARWNGHADAVVLPLNERTCGIVEWDWGPLVEPMRDGATAPEQRAAVFHESVVAAAVAQAEQALKKHEVDAIGLTGGVFQNRLLTELLTPRLEALGKPVFLPERLPFNDEAIAYGQILDAHGRTEGDL